MVIKGAKQSALQMRTDISLNPKMAARMKNLAEMAVVRNRKMKNLVVMAVVRLEQLEQPEQPARRPGVQAVRRFPGLWEVLPPVTWEPHRSRAAHRRRGLNLMRDMCSARDYSSQEYVW